jgi:hypothetical protein
VTEDDPSSGLSKIRMAGITVDLWTLTKFLSKQAVKDTYGVIETPETSGLIPTAASAIDAGARFQSDTRHEPDSRGGSDSRHEPNTDAWDQSVVRPLETSHVETQIKSSARTKLCSRARRAHLFWVVKKRSFRM